MTEQTKPTIEELQADIDFLNGLPDKGTATPAIDPATGQKDIRNLPTRAWDYATGDMMGDIGDFIGGAEANAKMQAKGYSTEGGDIGIRADAARLSDPISRGLKTMDLYREKYPGTEFKVDTDTKRLLVKKPDADKFDLIDPHGAEWGDVAEFARDIPALLFELGAVAVTGLVNKGRAGRSLLDKAGRVIGTGGAIASGAAIGEGLLQEYNISQDDLDHLSPEDQLKAVNGAMSQQALFAALGAAGGRLAGDGIKWLWNTARGKRLPSSFIEHGLNIGDTPPAAVTEINDMLKQAGSKLVFKPNSAQVGGDMAGEAAWAIKEAAKDPTASIAVKEMYENNMRVIEELADKFIGIKAPITDAVGYEAGHAAGQAIETELGGIEAQMARQVDDADTAATAANLSAENSAAKVPGYNVASGKDIRETIDVEADKVRDLGTVIYKPIVDASEDMKFYFDNTLEEIEKQGIKLDRRMIEILAPENRATLKSIFDKIMRPVNPRAEGGLKNPNMGLAEGETFLRQTAQERDVISQAITDLKELRRQIARGDKPGLESKAIDGLIDSFSADRTARYAAKDAATAGTPNATNLVADQAAGDVAYAAAKKKQLGVFEQLNAMNRGKYTVKDEQVFGKVFGPDTTHQTAAKDFGVFMKDPAHAKAAKVVVDSIFKDYFDTNMVGGALNSKKAAAWLLERKEVLGEYLSQAERDILENSASKGQALAAVKQQEVNLLKTMKKAVYTPGAAFRDKNPGDIFNHAWKKYDTMISLEKALKNHPEAWDKFVVAAKSNLRGEMTKLDPVLKEQLFSWPALDKIISDENKVQQIRYLWGDDYFNNLLKVHDAGKTIQSEVKAVNRNLSDEMFGALKDIAFGKLNRKRTAIGGIKKLVGKGQHNALLDIILDPVKLRKEALRQSTGPIDAAVHRTAGTTTLRAENDGNDEFTPPVVKELQKLMMGDPNLSKKARRALQ
mgnify:CR=1 FL=1